MATTVTFGDANEIALADLEAAREKGWDVARPDAYPSIFRKERGMSMRPPTAEELELMEACLPPSRSSSNAACRTISPRNVSPYPPTRAIAP